MPTKKPLSFEGVHRFLKTLFAEDLHAKRVLSLAGATLGVIESASLAVAMIGQGLALARGRLTKQRRRSEMLLGRAWDGGDHVVFEAVDGAIRSRCTYGSKGAATRAYNTAIANGYTELDAGEERFDRLCPALARAGPARTNRRAGGQ